MLWRCLCRKIRAMADIGFICLNPVRRNRLLGLFQWNLPIADQRVELVFQFILDVRVQGLGQKGFRPKILDGVGSPKFQADEMVDLKFTRGPCRNAVKTIGQLFGLP